MQAAEWRIFTKEDKTTILQKTYEEVTHTIWAESDTAATDKSAMCVCVREREDKLCTVVWD